MGNTNGREEGDNEEDPNRGSIDTDDYEVDGLRASSPRPSRSPLCWLLSFQWLPYKEVMPHLLSITSGSTTHTILLTHHKNKGFLITWTFGGKLLLSKDLGTIGHTVGFCRRILQRSGKDHSILLVLPSGIYQYRFVVDGERRYIPDLPCIADDMGLVDNLLDVHDYVPEYFKGIAEFEPPPSPDSSYGHTFPGDEDFAKEPVAVPPQLHLTLLGTQNDPEPSTKPQHVVLNIDKGWPSQSLVALGFTHRFQSKYVTVVLYKPLRK